MGQASTPAAGLQTRFTALSSFLPQILSPALHIRAALRARVQQRGAVFVAFIEGPQIQLLEAGGHGIGHGLAQRFAIEQRR